MSNLGYSFEVYCVDFFRRLFERALERNPQNKVFRVIGSGRNKLATKTGEDTLLEGDVSIDIDSLPKNLLIECKHCKSTASQGKSFTIKKEWVDQARDESGKNGRWSAVAIKFKHVTPNAKELREYSWNAEGKDGNSVHFIIPEKDFAEILSCLETQKATVFSNIRECANTLSTEELLNELKRRLSRPENPPVST